MAKARIDVWLTGAGSAALKVPLRGLGTGLARRFTVPMETVLFVRYADGQQRAYDPGEEVDTRDQAVALLVKTPRIEIPFEFDELPAKDDFWIEAACRLAVRAVPKAKLEPNVMVKLVFKYSDVEIDRRFERGPDGRGGHRMRVRANEPFTIGGVNECSQAEGD